MQKNYNKKRKLNKLKTSLLLLMMACFAMPAMAQNNVYMHTGSSTVTGNDVINFYDAGGKSSGPDYYWERWFNRSEDYTYTFKPEGNNKIKVTFKQFTAYTDNNGQNPAHAFYDHPQWALRLNTAELYIYDGMTTDAENLITMYTGSVLNEFTVIANGPMTFRFKSYSFREEGWEAEVQQVANYSLQKPSISFQVCDDQVVINANNKGGTIYYKLNQEPDPNDPLQGATEYNGSFPVDLNTTVYAIMKVGNEYSAAASLKYDEEKDVTPTPGKPTITRTGNTITMEPAPLIGDINETYEVWYKTEEDGIYVKYTAPIEWNTPNTTFYAITKPVSCSDKISAVETLLFDKVQVPDPTITFTNYNETTGVGTVTISCDEGYVISYTTNGSNPTTTGGVTGPITFDGTAGTTVKAIAYKITDNGSIDPDYKPSNIVVNLCLPGGEGSQGVYGDVVLLDDREPHTWTYYSDSESPIHSLNPTDIKITYSGYGEKTMTSTNTSNKPTPYSGTNSVFDADVAADQVAVNVNEPGNKFIYLKTLENANEAGTGNYPYTMIHNPFQVRPTFESRNMGNRDGETILISQGGSVTTNSATFYDSGGANSNYGNNQNYTITIYPSTSGSKIQAVFSSFNTESGYDYLYIYDGTSTSATQIGQYSGTTSPGTVIATNSSGALTFRFTSDSGLNYAGWAATITAITPKDYRGFYAWRVKRLSSDLSITDSDENTYGVGDIIYPGQEIQFVTEKSTNEVEFEALWAKAWVNESSTNNRATNSGNYQNAYERNFKTSWASYTYPVTYSSRYPDGTVATNTSFSVGSLDAGGDIKFENMTLTADRLNGNNHSLHIGRGVSNGNNNVTSAVYGYYNPSGNINGFTLRIESGRYTNAYLFYYTSARQVTSSNTWNMILGSDYDRANNKDNSKLTIAGEVAVSMRVSSSSATAKIDVNALSGTFGTTSGDTEFYMGFVNNYESYTCQTPRYLEVLGGNFLGGIAGGIERGVDVATPVLTMRIKGGTIHQYYYSSGQHSTAYGTRKSIITGGTFTDWVAGGCYGTDNSNDENGVTQGNSYIYFGGKASQTDGGEGIFGSGYGNYATASNRYTVANSKVVAADEAQIAGSVYGGGNNGYCTNGSEVYVKGTTLNIAGSVYGGANLSRTEGNISVTVKDGTIAGSVYGGAQGGSATTNIVYVTGKATVNIEGGTMTNVYGGGLGAQTRMNGGTEVNVKGGIINNNVYGGGALGTVPSGNTLVNVSGGSMKDVYGAGQGGSTTAQISGQTNVHVTGGSIANVYGGGEAGDVVLGSGGGASGSQATVVVTLSGSTYTYTTRSITVSYVDGGTTKTPTLRWSNNYEYGANTFNVDYGTQFSITARAGQNSNSPQNYTFTISVDGEQVLSSNLRDVTIPWPYSIPQQETPTPTDNSVASFVTIAGANISGDVFGGGKMGKTTGDTQVDIESGNIRGNVFGGAYGDPNQVFVAGKHTVNMMGGRIFGNLYGGSRNANDALAFTGYSQTEDKTSSVINISAGQVDQQVYAAGYYGKTFGSVYVMIGTNAILNAPHKAPSFGENNETKYKAGNLRLDHNVWAGGDWGEFQGGSFGAATVSGYSDIYVDGDGYDTETETVNAPTYMNIAGSIYCCGTSCDAGTKGRAIYVSNYGHANSSGSKDENFPEPYTDATRTLFSLQRADTLIINNSHINFIGQAKIYSLDATEKYAFVSFDKTVRIVNGSSLFLNAIASQIKDFWSASCSDVYAANATYSPVAYDAVSTTPNKIRVNGGNFIEVYHDKMINNTTGGYGMLNGFAYMMVAESTSDNTCAYARPKQCQDTPISNTLDNPTDGGFISYDSEKNTFDINGNSHEETGVTLGDLVQMPYENHVNQTKNGEQYFRIWRAGGVYSTRQAVVNIIANGQNTFDFVDVSVKLPAWRDAQSYFKFETTGNAPYLNTTIAYGSDVMMYNSAIASTSGTGSNITQNWIHFDEQSQTQTTGSLTTALEEMRNNPNVNFGLVTMAGTAMSGDPLIVCNESDAFLAKVTGTAPNYQTVNKFTCGDFEKNPEVTFRLTYSNLISTNMTWDPMYITLVQVDKNGDVKDIVKIAITINVATTIDREFVTQTYAIMNGTGSPNDEYVAKVVLPTFEIYDPLAEHLSQFKLQSVTFAPETGNDALPESWIERGGQYDINHFAMEISAANNEDNTDGWNGTSTGFHDSKGNANANGLLLGENGGREPFAFDFRLTYKGDITYTGDKPRLGVLTFNLTYDNVKVQTGTDQNGNPVYESQTKNLVIKVHVIRRGKGAAFYLDGQNGSNANDAKHPDKAVLALSTIYNRCGYLPGDIIYVVNTVDVAEELEWSGTKYNSVTIYRYPGGHDLSQTQAKDGEGHLLYWTDENHSEQTTTETDYPVMVSGSIVGNPNNIAHKGNLINVKEKGKMEIRDIILDGHKSSHPRPAASESKVDDAGVESTSPLINIASGGTLVLTNGTVLQDNNTTADGGAVAVNDGGTLMMNENATISNNVTTGDGGGVYMAGTMIVSDEVIVWNNKKAQTANNVFLTAADKVIQIGTTVEDEFGPLSNQTQLKDNDGVLLYYTDATCTVMSTEVTDYPVMAPRIGVTKSLTGDVEGFTRVVYVENENDIAWLDVPFNNTPNSIIHHDEQQYQLVQYKNPQFLYWIGTWVTVQYWNPKYESNQVSNYNANDFDPSDIDTPQELAWFISHVNGLNGATAHPTAVANITADIDMEANIWVPIGTANTPFKGTFEGNGHVITGIHSILANTNTGMFGRAEGATIQDVVAKVNFDGDAKNKGSVVGSMVNGTMANVEAAGTLVGKESTVNLGGLVGVNEGGTIHSSFAVNEITAENAETIIGGLVANNSGNLYNSYSNFTLGSANAATTMAGLVGVSTGTVENCYVVLPAGFNKPAFVHTNQVTEDETTTKGNVNYCYAASGITSYVGSDAAGNLTGHGTYANVKERKEIGYLYNDNAVTALTADTTYVRSKLTYKNGQIATWPGLLSTLNQWVKVNSNTSVTYTPWNRPTTSTINSDLPVLCFPSDNSLATEDGKFLYYGAADEIVNNTQANNGLDKLFTVYANKTADMFLYGYATGVTKGNGNNMLYINEDAVLIQAEASGSKALENIKATVGITFDNSSKKAVSTNLHQTLNYDWHFMSSPLQDAPINATFGDQNGFMNEANITGMDDECYFPNGLIGQSDVKWDFYAYSEKQYHWINLKRNDHFYQHNGDTLQYTNETKFVPGKGYMMAISEDSYMSSTGKLNKGGEKIHVTTQEPLDTIYNKGWNLVGNPYQAYLDLSQITGSFYIFDADQKVYAPVTTDQSTNPRIPSQTIHPHQAFFMHTDSNTDFEFDYAWATADPKDNSYYRGHEDQVNYPLVNLLVENEGGSRDLAVIELNRPELGGATKVQAMRNANFQIAASLHGKRYGILFTPENTEKVPVHFTTEEDGTFTLTWDTHNGDFTSLFLVDNMTGTITDMLRSDHYTFDAKTSDYASRFYLTYACTGVDEYNEGDGSFAFFDGSEWVVNGKGQLDIVDVTGRVLFSKRIANEQNRVNLNNVAPGVYMMRISDGKDTMVQKIVVK